MPKFSIDTSFPFPFFKLVEEVTYTEVKNPTGVSYMILVLLKETKGKTVKISDLLEEFGVPVNLHEIFAVEIEELISQEIIVFNDGSYDQKHFSDYKIDDFSFTPKGNKIFAEEQISTGKEKQTKIECYYDIALKQLSLVPDSNLQVKELKDCAFDDSFYSKFEVEKDVEDFFNKQKGMSFSIKSEEKITNVEQLEKENFVGRYDGHVKIDGDNLSLTFDNKAVQEFFEKYYTGEILNKALSLKNKFHLDKSNDAKLSSFGEDIKMILPSDFKAFLLKEYPLILVRGDYKVNKESKIISYAQSIDAISKYADIITVIDSKVNAFCPVNLTLKEERLGEIKLPIVVVLYPPMEKLANALASYIESKNTYSYEVLEEIVEICKITKDHKRAIEKLKSYMSSNSYGRNINDLKEIKDLAMRNNWLLDTYKSLLKENYDKFVETVTESTLESTLKITSFIPELLEMKKVDVLAKIVGIIGKPNNSVFLYETLIKSFDKKAVLSLVNPFPDVLSGITPNETELLNIVRFNDSLSKLKDLTGIKDNVDYSLIEDGLDKTTFKEIFIQTESYYKNIAIFKPSNFDYFKNADKFMDIFAEINDSINMSEAAIKNPENIKKEIIEKKISMGDYQFVLINLSIKLELLLDKKFNLKGNLSEKLNQAGKENLLSKEVLSDMHKLRQNRNEYAHPKEIRNQGFTADDLRKWTDEVFKIEEERK